MKKCRICNIEKFENEFHRRNEKSFRNECKECMKIYNKENKEKNKDKIKNYQDNYRIENKEKLKEYSKNNWMKNKEEISSKYKQYRLDNIEKYKEKDKNYYINNKSKINERDKKYSEENKDKISVNKKEYYQKNKVIIKEKKRIYIQKRRKEDLLFKLKDAISGLIYHSIRRQGYSKKTRTYKILGCSFEEFKLYIEVMFTEGMTWENHGEWHLDHIKPISLAKTEDEVYELNHYLNFQPLWAEDNIKKGNKF